MINAKRLALSALQIVMALSTFVIGFAVADVRNLYKRTDEKGEVHYSDTMPVGTKWEVVTGGKVSVIPSGFPTMSPLGSPSEVDVGKNDQASLDRAFAERKLDAERIQASAM